MYQPVGTIKDALSKIGSHEFVLPAIQREFVWNTDHICRLFDSIMQGYPFGEFLLWKIKPENAGRYHYYDFVQRYHERDASHCPELEPIDGKQVIAVLDGQQRLTAFNIGLRGSMAVKLHGRRWNDPTAFPRRVLALDLLATPNPEEEEGDKYAFEFVDDNQIGRVGGRLWFKVGDILQLELGPDMNEWLLDKDINDDQNRDAHRMLARLYRVVHTEPTMFCYEEENQEIEHVLNMFVRRNRGGMTLSYSDLLLSMAVSQWTQQDARKAVHEFVDELNLIGPGFNFSKDFVMKAGFMLADIQQVTFSAANVNHSNMTAIEDRWTKICDALATTVQLVSSLGFDSKSIGAESALLPIAYFLYQEDVPEKFLTHSQYKHCREVIRSWLTRSILKGSGVWGSGGGDSMLAALRSVIRDQQKGRFPVEAIQQEMSSRGRGLEFTQEEIAELSEARTTQHQRIFPLLSLLFPFVNTRDNRFHIDHVFPKSKFTPTKLRAAGVNEQQIETFRDDAERLGNLQLLNGDINSEKRAKLPADWLDEKYENDKNGLSDHCESHLLGDVPNEITDFEEFYEARRIRLQQRIAELVKTA